MDGNLKREFDYYLAHQSELVTQYNGKFVVIKGGKILGAYEGEIEAVEVTMKEHAAGTFLVQFVSPGEGAYSQSFHSRVAFS